MLPIDIETDNRYKRYYILDDKNKVIEGWEREPHELDHKEEVLTTSDQFETIDLYYGKWIKLTPAQLDAINQIDTNKVIDTKTTKTSREQEIEKAKELLAQLMEAMHD